MANPFSGRAVSISGPATDIIPVTPDDSNDLPDVAIALFVESGGALVFDSVSGEAIRTVNVGDGVILPVGARRVHATGTTASGIHALVIS